MATPMGDDVAGSARITITLDDTDVIADTQRLGDRIQRALDRATRAVGRQIHRNVQRGMRAAGAVAVRVEPDLRDFQRAVGRGLRGVGGISVPVTPDTARFTARLNRVLRRQRAEVQVTVDTRSLQRQVQQAVRRVRAPRLTVAVNADLARAQRQLRSLSGPRIEAAVVLDVARIQAQLRELAQRRITIPIHLGEPAGGGEGVGEGLLSRLRGSLSGAGAIGLGFGAEALAGIRAGLLAAGPWAAVVAGVAAYAVLVGKAITTGIEGVIQQQQITGVLRAQLGVSAGEAASAGRVVGQLYARGVVDSVEEGTAAVQAALRQGLAVKGDIPGLERISTQLQDVARLMEEDVGQVARAVGQMIKTGLVDDASQALDLFTRSVQQGGNAAGDLLDTFSEYSTQFRQLGLSAEEAFGLIQQGLKGGARDADVIADTLKEFSIEAAQGGQRVVDAFKDMGLNAGRLTQAFAKGGPDARRALDQVLDALHAIEDPLERNQAAVGLFGTKAEDMAGAISSLDLDTAARQLDDVGGAAERAGNALRDNLGIKLQRIGREAKQAFQGLFTGDFSQLADVGSAIRDALPDLKAAGKRMLDSLAQGIREYGPRLFQGVFKVGDWIGNNIDVWGPLLVKLAAAASSLPAIIGALLLTALAGAFKGLGQKLWPYLQTAWDAVRGFFTQTIPQWGAEVAGGIAAALGSAWSAATGAIASGVGAVVSFFTSLPGRIASALAALPGILIDLFTSAVAGVGIALLTLLAGIVYTFTELPKRIASALASLGSMLLGVFRSGFNAVSAAVSSFLSSVASFFSQLPGRVASALAALPGRLSSMFRSAGSSALSAAKSAGAAVVSFFSALPGRIASAVSSVGSRIAGVFRSAAGSVRSAVSSLIASVVSLFAGLPSRIVGSLGNIGSQIVSKIKSGLPSAVRKYLPFADGGIVLGPTHALIGEAGPEVVIPLTRPRRAKQLVEESGLLGIIGADGKRRGRGEGSVTIAPSFTIYEAGDGETTARRVLHRMAMAYGL